jgi:hypothetical protein
MPFNQLYPWQEPEQCFMGNNAEYADCKSESCCSIISCNAMDVSLLDLMELSCSFRRLTTPSEDSLSFLFPIRYSAVIIMYFF